MRRRPAPGFTLIELMVSALLLALLAGAAVQVTQLATQRSREQELRSALREIRNAIDAYKQAADAGRLRRGADDSGYPPSLDVLVDGVVDIRSPQARRLYFLRRLPRDPMADAALPAAQTWALRSYASPPDRPEPGRDVYDVHSTSPQRGLNGQPYASW